MQIKELLLGIPILFFVFWVFTAPIPQERISRACQPIQWVGNIATSTTALSSTDHTQASVRWSDKLNYSCQYLVWRLLYQDEYSKAMEAGLVRLDAKGNPIVIQDESGAKEAAIRGGVEAEKNAPDAPPVTDAGAAPKKAAE